MSEKPKKHKTDEGAVEYRLRDGSFHRDNGPSIVHPCYNAWHRFGLLHREDGPAIEYKDNATRTAQGNAELANRLCFVKNGDYTEMVIQDEWYLEGEEITVQEFWEKQKDSEHAAKIFAKLFGDNK